jgi:hypothetical protein
MRVPFHQQKNGCAGLGLAGDEVLGGGGLLVDGLHALLGQRAGVLDGLAALAVGLALESTPRGPNCFGRSCRWAVHVG